MRAGRRALASVALAGSTVLVGGAALAQDVVSPGWEASTATVEGTRLHGAMERGGSYRYWDGLIRRERAYTVTVGFAVARPPELPAACSVPTIPAPPPAMTRVPFDVTPPFECNGSYPVTITGRADADGGTATLTRTIVVAMPAPEVTGVEVALDDDAVDISWDDMTAQAKDLTGYRVTRQVDSGSPTTVTEVGRAPDGSLPTSARDAELPSEGEVLTYQVVAVRNETGPGPSGQTSRAAITREGEEAEPAPLPGGGTDPGPGPGGEPTDQGPGGGSSTASPRPSRPGRVAPPRIGITGTFRPPALSPVIPGFGPRTSTSTTVDGGYDEDLPYNPVDGPLEADAPDDELAAFFNEGAAGRGLAVPVATALVLAVWAFHLRVLARAAKPPA
ncbi:MAG: hypothetical protein ACO1PW_01340 [Actinomycetota bacterium]